MSQQVQRVMVIGPNMAGKSTFIYKFKTHIVDPEELDPNNPISEAVTTVNNQFCTLQDLNDYHENKKKQQLMQKAAGIILFIDSSDDSKFDRVHEYLQIISNISEKKSGKKLEKYSKNEPLKSAIYSKYESVKAIPLLIYCNKQDLPCKSVKQIGIELGLYQLIDYKQIFTSKGLSTYDCPENIIDIIIDYIPKEIMPIDEDKAMFHLEGTVATIGDGVFEGLDWLEKKMKNGK